MLSNPIGSTWKAEDASSPPTVSELQRCSPAGTPLGLRGKQGTVWRRGTFANQPQHTGPRKPVVFIALVHEESRHSFWRLQRCPGVFPVPDRPAGGDFYRRSSSTDISEGHASNEHIPRETRRLPAAKTRGSTTRTGVPPKPGGRGGTKRYTSPPKPTHMNTIMGCKHFKRRVFLLVVHAVKSPPAEPLTLLSK